MYKGHVVNLATYKHSVSLVRSVIKAALVGCRSETVTCDDGVHELFPKRSGFWMALESVLNREHHFSRDDSAVTSEIPVGILIIDDHERGLIWWRRVRIRVRRIHFQADISPVPYTHLTLPTNLRVENSAFAGHLTNTTTYNNINRRYRLPQQRIK